jgi:hypothetical protein
VAAINKYLAQSNKSRADGNATQDVKVYHEVRALAKINQRPDYVLALCRLLHDRATMRVKFEATDVTGRVHERSSLRHIYSHCVVIHFAAHLPSKLWPEGIAAFSHAEWEQSFALAERKASRWRKKPGVEAIEILEARQVPPKQQPRAGQP